MTENYKSAPKIWHIRSNEKLDYVVVDNKLVLDRRGYPKRHRSKIIGTLVLFDGKIGGAICCPEDTFSKKMGVGVALGRAKSNKGVPTKLRKHAKRMAEKYGVELTCSEPKPLMSKEIDWDNIALGTKIKARPYEEFKDDYDEFDISEVNFIKGNLGQVVEFSEIQDYHDEDDSVEVNEWYIPKKAFQLA